MTVIADFVKSPTATKDYHIDFGPYLKPAETVTTISFAVSPSGITVGSGAYDPTIDDDGKGCTFWLTGGNAGTQYTVTCHFTTDNVPPRIDDRSVLINVEGLASGDGVEDGSILSFATASNAYVPRRFWVIPDIDLTGVVAADTAVQEALDAAYPGAVVYLPNGVIRKTTTWTIPSGVTLTGSPRGFNFGQRMFSSGESNFGTLINEYGTGIGFNMSGQQCAVMDLTVYYPDQEVNATPDVYDYTFDIPGNSHGNTVGCCTVINPYRYMRIAADGFTGHDLTGRPLNMGIWFKRCADVVRMTNVHFKGVNFSEGAALTAYIAANATAFLIDGPEGLTFTNCFAFGYFKGIQTYDADLDGFRGTDWTWTGGGLDTCGFCILISESQCLMLSGARIVNAAFAPTLYGVRFDDTRVPSGTPTYIERPSLELVNVTMHGTFDRPIWLTSGSYGICRMTGGNVWGNSNPFFREPTHTQAWLQLQGVGMPPAVTRTEVGAGNPVVDDNPISF